MSDKTEKPDGDGAWVPSAEHPVPPTTEFTAVTPEAVESIDGTAEPDETPADAGKPADPVGSAPQPSGWAPPAAEAPAPDATTGSAAASSVEKPAADGPAAAAPSVEGSAAGGPAAASPSVEGSAAPETPAATADLPRTEEPASTTEPETPAFATPAGAAAATGGTAPSTDAPAWKTPPAAGLPPEWGDPDAQSTGPQPTNQASNLWGLAPEDRPEVLLGAALAGGVLTAILLRTLARR